MTEERPDLPIRALREINRALAYGDAKHGGATTRYEGGAARHLAGAKRHAARRELGQRFDTDSGVRSIAHEITRLLIALEIELHIEELAAEIRECVGELDGRHVVPHSLECDATADSAQESNLIKRRSIP